MRGQLNMLRETRHGFTHTHTENIIKGALRTGVVQETQLEKKWNIYIYILEYRGEADPFSIHAVVTLSRVSLPYLVALFVCLFAGSDRVGCVSVKQSRVLAYMSIKVCDVAKKTLLSYTSSYRLASELNVIMLKSPKLVRLADFYLRQHKKGFSLFLLEQKFYFILFNLKSVVFSLFVSVCLSCLSLKTKGQISFLHHKLKI